MPRKQFQPASKPTLASVLDHIGTVYRTTENNQKVLCAIHGDRKPSCSLDLGLGLWKCQSCGAGGDAWSLLMQAEGIDFRAAVGLADKLGLERADGPTGGSTPGRSRGVRQRVRSVYAGQTPDEDRTPYVPSWKR